MLRFGTRSSVLPRRLHQVMTTGKFSSVPPSSAYKPPSSAPNRSSGPGMGLILGGTAVALFGAGFGASKLYATVDGVRQTLDGAVGAKNMETVTGVYVKLGLLDEAELKSKPTKESSKTSKPAVEKPAQKAAPAASKPAEAVQTAATDAPAHKKKEESQDHKTKADSANGSGDKASVPVVANEQKGDADRATSVTPVTLNSPAEPEHTTNTPVVAVPSSRTDTQKPHPDPAPVPVPTPVAVAPVAAPLVTAPVITEQKVVAAAENTINALNAAAKVATLSKPLVSEARGEAEKEHAAYVSSLRHEIESSMLTDIHDLDTAALRARAARLADELLARAGWEGVRLFEASKHVEADLHKKYSHLMEAQRLELENNSKLQIVNREKEITELLASQSEQLVLKLTGQLHESLRGQFDALNTQMDKELKAQEDRLEAEEQMDILYTMAGNRQRQIGELMGHQDNLLGVSDKLFALAKAGSALTNTSTSVKDVHQKCAAVYAVESALTLSENPASEIGKIVNRLSSNDVANEHSDLLAAIINSLPRENLGEPVLSVVELKNRFKTVREQLRKVALAPKDAPSIVGQFVGTTLAAVSKPPVGLVPGEGLEEVLSRAAYYLDNGKLFEAVVEVSNIHGSMERKILEDWNSVAVNRLKVDVALTSLKALSILIAGSASVDK
jgi:hypothetical protein